MPPRYVLCRITDDTVCTLPVVLPANCPFQAQENHSDVFIHTDSPLLLLNAMPE